MSEKYSQARMSKNKGPSDFLPLRPAFGNAGVEVTLWSNYFVLKMNAKHDLWKYAVEVSQVAAEPKEGAKKDAQKSQEVKGPKRQDIIQQALKSLPSGKSTQWGSEFKSQVVSRPKLDLPEDRAVIVNRLRGEKKEHFKVQFSAPPKRGPG